MENLAKVHESEKANPNQTEEIKQIIDEQTAKINEEKKIYREINMEDGDSMLKEQGKKIQKMCLSMIQEIDDVKKKNAETQEN